MWKSAYVGVYQLFYYWMFVELNLLVRYAVITILGNATDTKTVRRLRKGHSTGTPPVKPLLPCFKLPPPTRRPFFFSVPISVFIGLGDLPSLSFFSLLYLCSSHFMHFISTASYLTRFFSSSLSISLYLKIYTFSSLIFVFLFRLFFLFGKSFYLNFSECILSLNCVCLVCLYFILISCDPPFALAQSTLNVFSGFVLGTAYILYSDA